MKTTIGGFDGMHLAHMELIKKSDNYLVIEKCSSLTPFFDRIEYSSKMLDLLILEKIRHLSKDEFIDILKNYGIREILIGYDFRFGKNRSGGIDDLKKAFKVEVIEEIKLKNTGIHSQVIREFIKKGNIKKANEFLGHTYKIKGIQIKGQGLGSKELVPTINIKLIKNYLLPKAGVYITKTNNFPSITFLGIRSTDGNFSIETHLLNGEWKTKSPKNQKIFWDTEENGKLIKIEFLEFLRENRKFNSLYELKKQIEMDIKTALRYNFTKKAESGAD